MVRLNPEAYRLGNNITYSFGYTEFQVFVSIVPRHMISMVTLCCMVHNIVHVCWRMQLHGYIENTHKGM